jgi:hypothetical protein
MAGVVARNATDDFDMEVHMKPAQVMGTQIPQAPSPR